MQTSKKRSVIVGLFILLGLTIFVVGVLTLGGQQKSFVKAISVKAIFQDIGGLQKGANVWFSGVKIGTVKKIEFYGTSQVLISMNIEEEAQKYIHKDSKAKISTDGLIGNKIIVLSPGTDVAGTVEAGDQLKSEAPLDTDEMMATLQQNNKNIIDITTDFKAISKRIANGEGTVGRLLTDASLVDKMEGTLANLQTITRNTNGAIKSFADYAGKLQTKGALSNELITDTVIFSNLRAAVVQMQQVAANATVLTENLKNTTADIGNKSKPLGMLMNDDELATDLKHTLKNLETSTQKLDENMEALQHNFLLRGFFKKRAKEEEKAAKEAAKTQPASTTP
jgi:phospholipid/cholesterol/gamma-HCH transport system substrate-binding protein